MANLIRFTGVSRPYALGEYSVDQNAKKLARYAYIHKRLMWIGCGQMPNLENWDLKQGVGRHLYEDSEATNDLRIRVLDLRYSPAQLEKAPDPFIELFFDEVIHAQNDLEYVSAVYEFIRPKLVEMYKEHVEKTQQIVDLPTIRMFRSIIADLEEQIEWGKQMIKEIQNKPQYQKAEVIEAKEIYMSNLRSIEELAGGLAGKQEKSKVMPKPYRSIHPYTMPLKSKRDTDMTIVHIRAGMGFDETAGDLKLFTDMMRVRQEEMTAAEMLAGVLFMQKDMEWSFYYEVARHIWDEIRHCMFGQAALEADGYDWRSRPQYTAAYDRLIDEMTSTRYAFLTVGVEDAGMKRPGKVGEYEFCRDTMKHPLMAQFQDYDWADEVNHAKFGRKWSPQLLDESLDNIREIMAEMTANFYKKAGTPLERFKSNR